MKKFMFFKDVQNNVWLVNVDHIVCIEQHNGNAKSTITLSEGRTLWMAEYVGEVYEMIRKHFEEYETDNN